MSYAYFMLIAYSYAKINYKYVLINNLIAAEYNSMVRAISTHNALIRNVDAE